MKIFELLNEGLSPVKDTVMNRNKEYVLHQNLYSDRQFSKFAKTYVGKFPAMEYIISTQEPRLRDNYLKDDFKNCDVRSTNVTIVDTLDIGYYDKLGPPPFNIVKTDKFYIDNAKKLKTIPSWFPTEATEIMLSNTGITSFKGIEKIIKKCEYITVSGGNSEIITSHLLGLILIEGLIKASFYFTSGLGANDAFAIIKKYIGKGRQGIMDCQTELIHAGLSEYAKL